MQESKLVLIADQKFVQLEGQYKINEQLKTSEFKSEIKQQKLEQKIRIESQRRRETERRLQEEQEKNIFKKLFNLD